MNNLSLLIYVASLAPKLGTLLGLYVLFGGAISLCISATEKKPTIFGGLYSVILVTFLTVWVILLPNETTVLLIAASELGEKAVYSEEFKALVQKAIK